MQAKMQSTFGPYIKKRLLNGRTANFNQAEKRVLVNLVQAYKDIIDTKRNDTNTIREKERAWLHVTGLFNKTFKDSPARASKSLQRCWKNMKAKAKVTNKSVWDGGVASRPFPVQIVRAGDRDLVPVKLEVEVDDDLCADQSYMAEENTQVDDHDIMSSPGQIQPHATETGINTKLYSDGGTDMVSNNTTTNVHQSPTVKQDHNQRERGSPSEDLVAISAPPDERAISDRAISARGEGGQYTEASYTGTISARGEGSQYTEAASNTGTVALQGTTHPPVPDSVPQSLPKRNYRTKPRLKMSRPRPHWQGGESAVGEELTTGTTTATTAATSRVHVVEDYYETDTEGLVTAESRGIREYRQRMGNLKLEREMKVQEHSARMELLSEELDLVRMRKELLKRQLDSYISTIH